MAALGYAWCSHVSKRTQKEPIQVETDGKRQRHNLPNTGRTTQALASLVIVVIAGAGIWLLSRSKDSSGARPGQVKDGREGPTSKAPGGEASKRAGKAKAPESSKVARAKEVRIAKREIGETPIRSQNADPSPVVPLTENEKPLPSSLSQERHEQSPVLKVKEEPPRPKTLEDLDKEKADLLVSDSRYQALFGPEPKPWHLWYERIWKGVRPSYQVAHHDLKIHLAERGWFFKANGFNGEIPIYSDELLQVLQLVVKYRPDAFLTAEERKQLCFTDIFTFKGQTIRCVADWEGTGALRFLR